MKPQIQLSEFIGDHGPYQLAITLVLFIRYVFLGLMANSGPLMTPDVTFYCQLPMEEVIAIMPNITTLSKSEQEIEMKEEFKRVCQLDLHLYSNSSSSLSPTKGHISATNSLGLLSRPKNSTPLEPNIRECTDFSYEIAVDQGRTMTSEFDLVCDRDWLRSLFQSLLSASIVGAHVIWGTFSDKYGRFQAQRLCLIVSLISGTWSIFATNFWSFVMARSLCSFGDLGMVVSLTTTVVELVGNQYRGLSVAIVNFGFALGVTILPYIVAYFEDFRLVIVFTVLCHLCTFPLILATNESVRWLLTNRKYNSAKKELKRISRWNRRYRLYTRHSSEEQISQSQRRKAFNELFSRLVDQYESQNLGADPEPTGSIISPEQENRILPSTDFYLNGIKMISTNPDFVGQSISRAHSCIDVDSGTTGHPNGQTVEDCVSALTVPVIEYPNLGLKRARSCSQLESLTQPNLIEVLTSENQKMLTLPAISRCTSKANSYNSEQVSLSRFEDLPLRGNRQVQQPDCINLVTSQLTFVGRLNRLFKDKQLMIAVFTIVWTTFNSELQYTSYIIINLEVGEDIYLNYILGGCMEALAAVTASLLLSYAPRRHSLIAFWLLISLSCFGLSIAHIDSHWAVWLLALAKFSQSSLSSIASVAAYESFPTSLRQSGSGLVFTLGMLGSVFAPLIFAEFDDQAGMDRVLMTFSFSSLTAATLIYMFLKETKNCELQ